jgi:hypothetical protein
MTGLGLSSLVEEESESFLSLASWARSGVWEKRDPARTSEAKTRNLFEKLFMVHIPESDWLGRNDGSLSQEGARG